MTAPFHDRRPGDSPVPYAVEVTAWNAAARDHRQRKAGRVDAGPLTAAVTPANTVLVRNDTGASLPEFSVLALGEPLVSAVDFPLDVQRRPYFPGATPSYNGQPFAVTTEPLAAGAIGRAVLDGMAVCTVNFTDTNHRYAGVEPGTTFRLTSQCEGPARVVWRAGNAGNQTCVVQVGPNTCNPEWAVEYHTNRANPTSFAYTWQALTPAGPAPFGNWDGYVVGRELLMPPFPFGAHVVCQVSVRVKVLNFRAAPGGSATGRIWLGLTQYASPPAEATDSVVMYQGVIAGEITCTGRLDFISRPFGGVGGYLPMIPVVRIEGFGAQAGSQPDGEATIYGVGTGPTALYWEAHCCEPETYRPEAPPPPDPIPDTPPVKTPTAEPQPTPNPGDTKFTRGSSVAWAANPRGGAGYPPGAYHGFEWYVGDAWAATGENPTFALDVEPGAYTVAVVFKDSENVEGRGEYALTVVPDPVRTVTGSAAGEATDRHVLVDASGGAATYTLPDLAEWVSGEELLVQKADASGNAVSIAPHAGQTVNGAVVSLTRSGIHGFYRLRRASATNWVTVGSG